jgi:hypothetical protein
MSFRSLMSNKITIYRKGLGTRDSDGYETTEFSQVTGMTGILARLVASPRSVVYRLEGTDVRASHQLHVVAMSDDGLAVDIQKEDRIEDEDTGVQYRVLEVHGANGRSSLHHYEGYCLEETEWQQSQVSS